MQWTLEVVKVILEGPKGYHYQHTEKYDGINRLTRTMTNMYRGYHKLLMLQCNWGVNREIDKPYDCIIPYKPKTHQNQSNVSVPVPSYWMEFQFETTTRNSHGAFYVSTHQDHSEQRMHIITSSAQFAFCSKWHEFKETSWGKSSKQPTLSRRKLG